MTSLRFSTKLSALAIIGLLFGTVFLAKPASAVTITYCSGGDQSTSTDGYDPDLDVNGACGSVPIALKKYLTDSGYSDTAAAGIMGNISAESCGFKLRVYNNSCSSLAPDDFVAYQNGKKTFSGGYGLAQWTSAGRVKNLQDHADSLGKSVNSLEVQASFIVKELTSSSYRLNQSKLNAMTLEQVVWVVLRDYETPASVICDSSNSGCKNQQSARDISLTTLLNNKTTYASAYSSYTKRLSRAKDAQAFSTAVCDSPSSSTDPTSGDPTPVNPTSSDDGHSSVTTTPTTSTNGALGKQSSSGFYAQGNYKGVRWRKTGDNPYISLSGCSLIAVANSAKYLGVTPNDPKELANWSKTAIENENDTGWNGSVKKTISHLGMKWNGNYLWSSYTTPTASKIAKIREVLAAGGVVIAGGDRKGKNNPYPETIDCNSSSNKNAGLCVFSNNGHFITIIGITADDKLIVANAANGRNGTSSNDKLNANNVLKFSNKAIGVYK